ncbi:MAG: prepilin-type N-terminal cleavage/methylation domain-containing protein [Candidatus Wolfebacteria bacterium]|nr:prepilin-type N-terminal cleavage/methylation domain-containing protein [Candidatus Wolfebacteria bacterium]
MPQIYKKLKGFTLVEIIIAVFILAFLTILVVVLLDPADFFPGARDTRRISDLQAIDSALSIYKTEVGAFFKSSSVATDPSNAVIGLVRQDCTGYSNCFTSLFAWQAAFGGINFGACAQGDLVCANKSAVAKIDGTWTNPDTSRLNIDGWTTSPSNYIRIYTAQAARHNGKWNTNKYRLEVSGQNPIGINEDYVRIEGLQIRMPSPDYQAITNGYSGADIRINNNIIRGAGGVSNSTFGLYLDGNINTEIKIWNNIIYDLGSGTSLCVFSFANQTTYAYNNTCVGAGFGFYRNTTGSGKMSAINNIAQNTTDGFNGVDSSSDYNISDLSNDAQGTHSKNSTTVLFVSTSTPDYHLSLNDLNAKGAGMKGCSSSSIMTFQDDIDGQPRGGSWDIGADQAVPDYKTVFTSLPDNNSACCASYSLPSLPSDWTYGCVVSTGLQQVNSGGWIPLDFTNIAANAMSFLSIDPGNSTSSGQYYTFVSDGKKWELTSILESDKNKGVDKIGGKDGGQYANILEIGSNLTLTPSNVKNR